VGQYDTTQSTEVANAPQLNQVLQELKIEIAKHPEELPEGRGVLVIEDWQTDAGGVSLKKVTLRILWKDAIQPYENTVYVHRDSAYSE